MCVCAFSFIHSESVSLLNVCYMLCSAWDIMKFNKGPPPSENSGCSRGAKAYRHSYIIAPNRIF